MGLEEAEQVYFHYPMDFYPFRPPEHGFLDFRLCVSSPARRWKPDGRHISGIYEYTV